MTKTTQKHKPIAIQTPCYLLAMLMMTACSGMSYEPRKFSYYKDADIVRDKKNETYGTFYMGSSGETSSSDVSMDISRKDGRYRAHTNLIGGPVPMDFSLTNRGREFRAGIEWTWRWD